MRIFIIAIAWWIGYLFTLTSVIKTSRDGKGKKGDKENAKMAAKVAIFGIVFWPLYGTVFVAAAIAKCYKKKEKV